MPIRGLSDRDSVDPRFKEIGRIRKGSPKRKRNGKDIFGEDLDYFRFVPDSKYPEAADVFRSAYGEQPTKLTLYFPFDRMEENFSSWREAYGQNRLCKLRCDGECWHDWIKDGQHYHSTPGRPCDLEFKDVENGCPRCPCQHVGRLSIILEDMWTAGFIGLITVITHSKNDIANLAAKLVQWEPLTGRPFSLWREPEHIGVPIQGKRARVEKSLLHLELTEQKLREYFEAAKERENRRNAEPPPDSAPRDDDAAEYDDELVQGDAFLAGDDYSGAPMDADAYDDLREEQDAEKAIAELYGDEAGKNYEGRRVLGDIGHEADLTEAKRELGVGKDPTELIEQGQAKMHDESTPVDVDLLVHDPPLENDWTRFYDRCLTELHYSNARHAGIVKDELWLQDPRPAWSDLWAHMIQHQVEKGRLVTA